MDMPRGLGDMSSGQWCHLDKSDKWQEIPYTYKESELKNGDVIIYKRYSGSQHVCIYVVIGGKGYLAEASLKTYYGHLTKLTSGSKIFNKTDKEKFKVYRATDEPDKPIGTNETVIEKNLASAEEASNATVEVAASKPASNAVIQQVEEAAVEEAAPAAAEITEPENAPETAEEAAPSADQAVEIQDDITEVNADAVLPDDGIPKG